VTRDEIQALFARREQDWLRHDAAALAADYAEDALVISPFAGTIAGRANIEKVFQSFFQAFPDVVFKDHELLIDGDRVAHFSASTGTHLGDFFGLKASGRRFEVPVVWLYEFRGGKIVQERRTYDFTGLLVQVGVIKAKPSA
jgi:steroid delta-isomerase-like uncharacterized protein